MYSYESDNDNLEININEMNNELNNLKNNIYKKKINIEIFFSENKNIVSVLNKKQSYNQSITKNLIINILKKVNELYCKNYKISYLLTFNINQDFNTLNYLINCDLCDSKINNIYKLNTINNENFNTSFNENFNTNFFKNKNIETTLIIILEKIYYYKSINIKNKIPKNKTKKLILKNL
tara:strand:- start:5501 stop:6037 length:537 start_codon:yes stop_codon:yes gene_type:complete